MSRSGLLPAPHTVAVGLWPVLAIGAAAAFSVLVASYRMFIGFSAWTAAKGIGTALRSLQRPIEPSV